MEHTSSWGNHEPVARLGVETRATFIAKAYMHLFGAMLAFTGLEILLFTTGVAQVLAQKMLGFNWLLILGAFMIAGWFASRLAHRAVSLPAQYAGLALTVVANAILFVPLLYVAESFSNGGVIKSAALVTLLGFASLTAVVFVTRKDFSFLGAILKWGFLLAIVLIAAAVIFGFNLGTYFSVAMVGLAGLAVLKDTSDVLHHYSQDRYVAASLELFASVALMFWYILRLFMSRD